MTCAQQKQHFDELKATLSGQTTETCLDGLTPNSESQMNSKEPTNVRFENSSLVPEDSTGLGDKHMRPPNPTPLSDLPDNYLCEGSPDKMVMDALKELNIQDIQNFLKDNHSEEQQFKKGERAPPLQYHLESSCGNVKDWLTAYDLQHYFGGYKIKDFSLLSQLGDGITVDDDVNEIPTVGKLVNHKWGKCHHKGSKATVHLEVVGMDIGYVDGAVVGGSKYALILVHQCTTQSFVYRMHGSSGADVCEALWKFFIDAWGFPHTL